MYRIESMIERERAEADLYRIRLCRICGHRHTMPTYEDHYSPRVCPRCLCWPDGRRATRIYKPSVAPSSAQEQEGQDG